MYGNMSKNDADVKFPIWDLDLTEFCERSREDERYLYDLFAVSNHDGSLHGGHYTAYAKTIGENKWFEFNDSIVQQLDPDMMPTQGAFALFYERKK